MEEFFRRDEGHREFEYRSGGGGPCQFHGDPGAVIETAVGLRPNGLSAGFQNAGDPHGQQGAARRRVGDAVEFFGEAAEIIEQGSGIPGSDAEGPRLLAVRGNDQYPLSAGMPDAKRSQSGGMGVATEGGHRRAVGEKDRGETIHDFWPSAGRETDDKRRSSVPPKPNLLGLTLLWPPRRLLRR